MDMEQRLDKLRPSAPLKIKRKVWTISMKDGKYIYERKDEK